MIISKQGLPHAEQYLVALRELRQQYLDWRHSGFSCPLCAVPRTNCGECPWRVFTGNVCFGRLRYLEQESLILRNCKPLRKIALKINKPIAKRIKELDLWVAVYERYLYYTTRRQLTPSEAVILVNLEIKDGVLK